MKGDLFFDKEDIFVLLFGGQGCERDVSLLGAYNFLKKAEYAAIKFLPIYVAENGAFYILNGNAEDIPNIKNTFPSEKFIPTFPVRLGKKSGFILNGDVFSVKLVFPLLHGDWGEDGIIQGLLSAAGVRFVGADVLTGALASDKVYSKIIARGAGVPTLPEITFKKRGFSLSCALEKVRDAYSYPVFVKPRRLGSSIGASVAFCEEEFAKSIEKAFLVSDLVMVEPALVEKRELECAYYNIGNKRIITPPAEISVDGKFYDYDLKYGSSSKTRLTVKAEVENDVIRKIMQYTDDLADAFSARHLARFDYFLTSDGAIYFNEVNTLPGMTGGSLYTSMLAEAGVDFQSFIKSLADI